MEPQVDPVDAESLATVAGQLWGLVAELDDPESELTATHTMRRRIEGAALALGSLADRPRGV